MSLTLLVLMLAAITALSRVVSLAFLPAPSGAVAAVVERLPVPLFAALAAVSLVGARAGATDPGMLAGLACALIASRRRSLLLVLAAGVTGYLVVDLLR